MAEEELYQMFRRYVGAINSSLWSQMPEFIASPASFNGVLMTPEQYGESLASFSNTCENGLYVELLDVIIDAARGRIAAKLVATGRPVMEFFGMHPTGNSVTFKEAAFYTIEHGKIVKVSTIVDRADIAESLAGQVPRSSVY